MCGSPKLPEKTRNNTGTADDVPTAKKDRSLPN